LAIPVLRYSFKIINYHQEEIQKLDRKLLQTVKNFKKSFQSETKTIKNTTAQNINEAWEGKRMHEQLPCSLDEKLVGKEQSHQWLRFGDSKGETEGTIVALRTNYFNEKVLKEETK
jgi:hypothetical protein